MVDVELADPIRVTTEQPVIAINTLVLSGGASLGDFEVGAVRRLYELGFQPKLIVGTSVGAVNGVKLAEGEGRGSANSPSGLEGLEKMWLSLNSNADFYVPNPNFTAQDDFKELEKHLFDAANDLQTSVEVGAGASLLIPGVGVFLGLAIAGSQDLQSAPDNLTKEALRLKDKLLLAKSLYSMSPILQKLSDAENLDTSKVATSDIDLLMPVVSLESGDLRLVTGKGEVLEEDAKTPYREGIPPACQSLATALHDAEQEYNRLEGISQSNLQAGVKPGSLVTAVQTAFNRLRAARAALDACRSTNASQCPPLKVSVVDGVMASAALPLSFEPCKLGLENYVDGGVRSTVPIWHAIAAGATKVWAVVAGGETVGPATSILDGKVIENFDSSNMADIAMRVAADIMPNQILRSDVDPPSGWGAVQVFQIFPEPKSDVHKGTVIDPGLIRIRMAHGYMRADDVWAAQVAGRDPEEVSVERETFDIVKLRHEIWIEEFAANGRDYVEDAIGQAPFQAATSGADLNALKTVREKKLALKALVNERIAKGGGSRTSRNR